MIGSGSVVTKDIAEYALVVGVPAKMVSSGISTFLEKQRANKIKKFHKSSIFNTNIENEIENFVRLIERHTRW